jgi:acyl carrier protein
MITREELRAAVTGQVHALAARPTTEPIGPDEHLTDEAGLDSVAFLALLVWVEDHYRIDIPDELLAADELATIAGLGDYIHARLG